MSSKQNKSAISPTRQENYPEWYQQVIKHADLAESSPVRGSMVIKPWGYAIWEAIKGTLDKAFKDTGHENVYFPLFIPLSFLQKEAEHVEGFAKECAVVTHSRLAADENGKLVPASPLEEPLIVRPTSETIIADSFSRWIESYRDLPMKLNQWANIVRWEMRTRPFLRTTEILWQEGHTAHATAEEALEEAKLMLQVYKEFCWEHLAYPVLTGEKSPSERFPGAENTFTIEAMMQDRKALQSGTSHFLGQKFAKAGDITFLDKDNQLKHAWTTSWGVTTRLIGGAVMTHADDDGMVLPPRIAPKQVILLPVIRNEETREAVEAYCERLKSELEAQKAFGEDVRVQIDARDLRGGDKLWQWVKKGAPIIAEVGPRDMENDSVFFRMRHLGPSEKHTESREVFVGEIAKKLESMQKALLERALNFRKEHTVEIDSEEDFYAFFTPKNQDRPEIHGGFAYTHWNGSADVEERIQKELSVTIRCIPDDHNSGPGTCPFTGEPSAQRAYWAKAY